MSTAMPWRSFPVSSSCLTFSGFIFRSTLNWFLCRMRGSNLIYSFGFRYLIFPALFRREIFLNVGFWHPWQKLSGSVWFCSEFSILFCWSTCLFLGQCFLCNYSTVVRYSTWSQVVQKINKKKTFSASFLLFFLRIDLVTQGLFHFYRIVVPSLDLWKILEFCLETVMNL